jgi:thioredoxin 1
MSKQIVKYGAKWCNPCNIQSRIFSELVNDYRDISFIEIDIQNLNEDTLTDLGIKNIPTIFFKDGNQILKKHVGMLNKDNLIKEINQIFK